MQQISIKYSVEHYTEDAGIFKVQYYILHPNEYNSFH